MKFGGYCRILSYSSEFDKKNEVGLMMDQAVARLIQQYFPAARPSDVEQLTAIILEFLRAKDNLQLKEESIWVSG